MCQWREARKMRLSLTTVRCFQKPLWVFFPLASCSWSHRRPCYQLFMGVGGLDQSQYGNTRPHLPTEANSQKRPLGIQDRTWLGKFHPPPPWKRSHTYFLRKGPLVLCGPGRPESLYAEKLTLDFWFSWLYFLSAGVTSMCQHTKPNSRWCPGCLNWSPAICSWPFVWNPTSLDIDWNGPLNLLQRTSAIKQNI